MKRLLPSLICKLMAQILAWESFMAFKVFIIRYRLFALSHAVMQLKDIG